jgi:hypothetical protein
MNLDNDEAIDATLSPSMHRRLSIITCATGLFVTLWVAAFHKHAHALSSDISDSTSSSCVYCTGGLTSTPAPCTEPLARLLVLSFEPSAPEAPALRPVLPLAHSGNAPPSLG